MVCAMSPRGPSQTIQQKHITHHAYKACVELDTHLAAALHLQSAESQKLRIALTNFIRQDTVMFHVGQRDQKGVSQNSIIS